MPSPMTIDAGGKTVSLALMDDSWIINQCAGGHPFKPRPGVVWTEHDRCGRLPEIPGDKMRDLLQEQKNSLGNCAVVAWHDGRVLGHLVWMARSTARTVHASGCQFFGQPEDDEGVLVVINLAFCSLGGHEFRRKGVGKAMVGMMADWARENGWSTIEVYDVSGGLFPWDWLDFCIPPKPFWEGRGFKVMAERPHRFTNEELAAALADNPRNSEQEQAQKRQTIDQIQAGAVDESQMGHFDLRLSL
ncbi:MAG: GNAT family N-acetyltransferase [Phycisphaerae bacterium]|jgi:GNAT superfamily N-acetyltransferase